MAIAYIQKLRLFSRDARLFLLSVACIGLAYYGGSAVLQNLYLLRLGYGPEFIGLVFAVGSLMPAIFSVPAGAISRRWGLRRAMIVGIISMPLGAVLVPCAEFVPEAYRSAWILAASALSWAGGPLFIVNAAPFLAGATEPAERSYAFSVFMALFPLAGFIGGMISGRLPALFAGILGTTLNSPVPFRYPLWLAAALYVPGLVALLATRGDGRAQAEEEEGGVGPAPIGIIVVFGIVALLRMTAAGVVQSFFNVYLDLELQLSPSSIGTLIAIGQLVGGIAALSAPILIARGGMRRTYVSSSLWTAISYLPLALIPHWVAAGTGFLGITAMGSIAQPTANVFGQEAVEPRWRTAVSSAAVMAMGVGYSIAGLGGGQAVATIGYRPVFLIAGVLPAAGALLFWAYFRAPLVAPVHDAASDPVD